MPLRIEDYAMIGDCLSAALVGRDGSIDWLCWPRFDSSACFAALLGTPENGRWLIAPHGAPSKVSRRYQADTLVLETEFQTETGTATVVDFMPATDGKADLVRVVFGRSGEVKFRTELVIRFGYGAIVPWVNRAEDGTLHAVAGPDRIVLHTPVALYGEDLKTVAEFTVSAGQSVPFILSYGPSFENPAAPIDPFRALKTTRDFWREWTGRCPDVEPWTGAVKRSLITLKALTYAPTGGIVAAVRTSLPERLAGSRNWDYRFCWLRDATFTLLAFMHLGYYDEAQIWRDWLIRTIAGSPHQVQIMYGVGGERWLPELVIPWLAGYENSSPVRNGSMQACYSCRLSAFFRPTNHACAERFAPSKKSSSPRRNLFCDTKANTGSMACLRVKDTFSRVAFGSSTITCCTAAMTRLAAYSSVCCRAAMTSDCS